MRPCDLVLECKYCSHPIIKKGGWFMTAHHFECKVCKRDVLGSVIVPNPVSFRGRYDRLSCVP
jgi:hypothetical protein